MFKRYKAFFRAGAINTVAYRTSTLVWLGITALEVLCVFFLWVGVYKSSPDGVNSVINGFTFYQMLTYMVFVNIFNFVTFGGDTMQQIAEEIDCGTIATSLIKPISYRKRYLFTTLGNYFMCMVMVGLPLFTVAYVLFAYFGYLAIPPVWTFLAHIALFLVAQVLSVLIMDCINYICGVLCFYTTAWWGLNQLKNVVVSFLSGTLIPLAFFPPWAGKVLQYSPFAGLSQNPVFVLMVKVDLLQALQYVAISLVWYVALEAFAYLLFNKAIKKVTVQGG